MRLEVRRSSSYRSSNLFPLTSAFTKNLDAQRRNEEPVFIGGDAVPLTGKWFSSAYSGFLLLSEQRLSRPRC